MSKSKKPTEERKPQPSTESKPVSPAPSERNLRTGYTFVTDSAENIRKKDR